jgi:hypothetical protein
MTRAIKLENERQRANEVLRDGKTQIELKLEDDPWHEVGAYAAYACQMRTLGLRPWQCPPAHAGAVRGKRRGREYCEQPDALALLKRLLDNNLSRYEPDPLRALERIQSSHAT